MNKKLIEALNVLEWSADPDDPAVSGAIKAILRALEGRDELLEALEGLIPIAEAYFNRKQVMRWGSAEMSEHHVRLEALHQARTAIAQAKGGAEMLDGDGVRYGRSEMEAAVEGCLEIGLKYLTVSGGGPMTFEYVRTHSPIVASILAAGGSCEDCVVGLVQAMDSLTERVSVLEGMVPRKYRLDDGRVLIWRCPDNLVPEPLEAQDEL